MVMQVFPESLKDISSTGHDGEMIARELLAAFDAAEAKAAPAKVSACTTDAAADCCKGRRNVQKDRCYLASLFEADSLGKFCTPDLGD